MGWMKKTQRPGLSQSLSHLIILLILLQGCLFEELKCPINCISCSKDKKCDKCRYGYGIIEEECTKCDQVNCKYCDGHQASCIECAIYHFKKEDKEKKGIFICTKCGFGCMECKEEEKCIKCGQMFSFSEKDPDVCIADHKKLFLILLAVLVFLMISVSFGFYCTNLSPDEEKALIEKLERKKRENEESEEGGSERENRRHETEVNQEARRRRNGDHDRNRPIDTELSRLSARSGEA